MQCWLEQNGNLSGGTLKKEQSTSGESNDKGSINGYALVE